MTAKAVSGLTLEQAQKLTTAIDSIQKGLDDLNKRVNDHHKSLYGNGNPEISFIWELRKLGKDIADLNIKIDQNHVTDVIAINESKEAAMATKDSLVVLKDEIEILRGDDANLSWKQWFKKLTIKWLPILLIITITLVFLGEPLTKLLEVVIKWMA